MDHNEHVTNGPLGKLLADKEGLDLQEAILLHTGSSPGATYFRGSKPIDGLWVLDDLDIGNVCIMPFRYGIGDHRDYILDTPLKLLVGENPIKIVRPAGRHLNSKLLGCSKAYIKSLEDNIINHQLLERLHKAHTGAYSENKRSRKVIIIDKEGKAYMRHTKKVCRKLKCCRIPFSPEAVLEESARSKTRPAFVR